ncbi:MAG: glycosyltransferase family 2 protein, partial [Ignavibacteria bacterium]|nr:glycosyltransferase family 2 protein [Ignavibacteria bacterium]
RVLLNPKIGGYLSFEDKKSQMRFEPKVSMIIACYNEEDYIEAKVKNCNELDYPEDKIEFIFITDGSDDSTNQKLMKHLRSNLNFYYEKERKGKLNALKRGLKYTKNDILIFSDANSIYNRDAIKYLVRHFVHDKVGCVAGEKRVLSPNSKGLEGESLYWKYESVLKNLDSELFSVVGAAGEIFAIRKNLFLEIPSDAIIEDFILSIKIAELGYRVVYEPNSYSIETPPKTLKDEFLRRLRICRGGIQSIKYFQDLLKFKKSKILSFQFISHRILRWTIAPISFVTIFILNIILFQHNVFYEYFFYFQLFFYLIALIGLLFDILKIRIGFVKVISSFALMNFSAIVAIFTINTNRYSNIWLKTNRA